MNYIKDALAKEAGLDATTFGTKDEDIISAAEGYFPKIADTRQ